MNKSRIRYLIGFLIIVGALGYLLLTTFQSSLQYYVTVSELKAAESSFQDRILKVAGKASDIKRIETAQNLQYQFIVKEGESLLHVAYEGLVPDTFKEDSDVVVTGSLNPDGTFKATHILAKCASKYEAKLE